MIASRGSVVPLFIDQIRQGGPVTITVPEMTRFLLSVDQAVDTVFTAVRSGQPGETFVPKIPAARVVDIATMLINGRDIPIVYTGIRPAEKLHEIMVSEEETFRTIERDGYYVILPVLPELRAGVMPTPPLTAEYCSRDHCVGTEELREILAKYVEEAEILSA